MKQAAVPARRSASISDQRPVTEVLKEWNQGDSEALERLIPMVYEHLRDQARCVLRDEGPGHTLQPTALVHEVYLRLARTGHVRWQGRTHFFAAAARIMRHILVDHARARKAAKRGSRPLRISLTAHAPIPDGCCSARSGGAADRCEHPGLPELAHLDPKIEPDVELLALDQALDDLEAMDSRQARVVELRYFAGLTIAEVATLLEIGTATVERDWRSARVWLYKRLRGA